MQKLRFSGDELKHSLLCTAAVLGASMSSLALAQSEPVQRAWWQFGLEDYVMDEVVLFNLGNTYSQAADASEVLETASRIVPGSRESWTREWVKTAERLQTAAEESEAAAHEVSASAAYLRASTYYRAALHSNLHPGSNEVRDLSQREANAFERYLELSEAPCRPVAIPYEDTTLPGYFCRSPKARRNAPVVIFNPGRDVWAEDAKLIMEEAMKRGYHALSFDGPGQGRALRLQNLVYRPDWEKVVGPVVDFAVAQRGVDRKRIVLWGESMGGYLVPRAAALEPRLKLIIANPGVIDWYRTFEENIEAAFPGILDNFDGHEAEFDRLIADYVSKSEFLRWGLEDYMWKHGVNKPSELVHDLRKYRLGELVTKIRAHTLVVDAEAEDRGQAPELFTQLQAPKDYLFFTAEEAAQFHDQPGARAIAMQRIYDWIDDNL